MGQEKSEQPSKGENWAAVGELQRQKGIGLSNIV